MLKLIHPKTEVIREVPENYHTKIAILERAGFVRFDSYKPKKAKAVVPDPTVAEIVAKNKEKGVDPEDAPTTEIAIHVSSAARALIEEYGLDPALIEGTGINGQINKPDVQKHIEALEASNEELPEQPSHAEDILTHDDPAPLETEKFSEEEIDIPHDPESAVDADGNPNPSVEDVAGQEPVVRDATEEEEAAEAELSKELEEGEEAE